MSTDLQKVDGVEESRNGGSLAAPILDAPAPAELDQRLRGLAYESLLRELGTPPELPVAPLFSLRGLAPVGLRLASPVDAALPPVLTWNGYWRDDAGSAAEANPVQGGAGGE